MEGIVSYCYKLFRDLLIPGIIITSNGISAADLDVNTNKPAGFTEQPFHVEYINAGMPGNKTVEMLPYEVRVSANTRITQYRDDLYQVVIHEIDRGYYTEYY